jgi:hypothetical protein
VPSDIRVLDLQHRLHGVGRPAVLLTAAVLAHVLLDRDRDLLESSSLARFSMRSFSACVSRLALTCNSV